MIPAPIVTPASRRRRRHQPSLRFNSQLPTSSHPSTSRSSLPRSSSSRSSNSYSRAHPRRTNGSAASGPRSSSSWPSSCRSTRSRSSGNERPERRSGCSRSGRLSPLPQQVIMWVVVEEEKKSAQTTGMKMSEIIGSARSVCEGAVIRPKKTRHRETTTTQEESTTTTRRSRPSLLTLDVAFRAPTPVRVHSSPSTRFPLSVNQVFAHP